MTSKSDSQKIWYLRLGAEGVVIIVSILLAFSIDAWWAGRQDDIEERRVLTALRADFAATLDSVREVSRYREAVIESAERLFLAAAGKAELTADELDSLLGDLVVAGNVDFSTGALDSLFQGGALSTIQNPALRQQFSSFTYVSEWTKRLEDPELERLHKQWNPFLSKNASLPQIENAKGTVPGSSIHDTLPRIPLAATRDHSYLLDSDEFLGLLASELSTHNSVLNWYASLARRLEDAIDAIDTELGQ